MFGRLKSLAKKVTSKAKGMAGKLLGKFKKPEVNEPKIETPTIDLPNIPKGPKNDKPFVDAGIIEHEMTKAKQFYMNMISQLDGLADDMLLTQARNKILNATDEQLDELLMALGDDDAEDWKDFYNNITYSFGSMEDKAADANAKLDLILSILS